MPSAYNDNYIPEHWNANTTPYKPSLQGAEDADSYKVKILGKVLLSEFRCFLTDLASSVVLTRV